MLTDEVHNLLKPDADLCVIICVGNTLRFDDAVGPYIASNIHETENLRVFDAAYNPEDIIDDVIAVEPDKIIIIDAADFRGRPGEAKIIEEDKIPESTLSTHTISLKVIYDILASDTKARIKFLGIQPKQVNYGEGLSPEVQSTADEIIAGINREFADA